MGFNGCLINKNTRIGLFLYVIALFLLPLSLFQSCAPKTALEGGSDRSGVLGEVILTLDPTDLGRIEFSAFALGVNTTNPLGSYSLDVQAKQLVRLDTDGNVTETCKPDLGPINIVLEHLNGSQVCDYPENTDPDRLCTLIYSAPYATLYFVDQVALSLGEKTSGCSKTTDLCSSEKEIQFKDDLKDLLSSAFSNGTCSGT